MTYVVSAPKSDCGWRIIAAFNIMSEAVKYAAEKTQETGEYHLVEVMDGGKH